MPRLGYGCTIKFPGELQKFLLLTYKKKKKNFFAQHGHAAAWIRVHNQVSGLIAKIFFFSLKKKKFYDAGRSCRGMDKGAQSSFLANCKKFFFNLKKKKNYAARRSCRGMDVRLGGLQCQVS